MTHVFLAFFQWARIEIAPTARLLGWMTHAFLALFHSHVLCSHLISDPLTFSFADSLTHSFADSIAYKNTNPYTNLHANTKSHTCAE